MKSKKLSTLKTPQGGGALNSEKIAEKADKNGTFSDLKTAEKTLKKETKNSLRDGNKIAEIATMSERLCQPKSAASPLSFRNDTERYDNKILCHCEAEQGSAVAISPLCHFERSREISANKENKKSSLKIYALILSIIFLFTALVGGSVFLIVNHINKTTATTESPTLTTNLFTTSGTINKSGVQALLNVVGTDTGTYTAHEIASDGKSVIFPMGYYVDASGTIETSKTLYWQATYKRGGYLTIWLTQPYTCARYNNNGTTSNAFDPGTDHSGSSSSDYYSNYSMSQLRDTTKNIYNLLIGTHAGLDNIIVAPSTSAISAWQSAQDDVYTAYSSSDYAHNNGLGTYSGDYSWGSSTGTAWSSCLADKMWIPSAYEIFNTTTGKDNGSDTNGLWGLTATDNAYTDTRIDTGASSSSSGTGYSQSCWLRSGYSGGNYGAMRVNSSGSAGNSTVNSGRGVRPACHISLSALKATLTTTVTLNKQSGSGGTSSVSCSGGSAMPSITIPTRTGYTFGGYYTSTNGGGTQYYTATGASARSYPSSGGPTILYAKWTGNTYYVKYNANGGSGTMSISTHIYGTASNLTANIFTYTGHNFAGWATSSTGAVVYANGASVSTLTSTSGGTFNLYAVWEAKPYTINLLTNDSALGNVLGGGRYNLDENTNLFALAQAGCAFLYWIDSSAPNTQIYANPLSVTITSDKTYTAYFTDSLQNGVSVVAEAGGEARINGYTDSDTTIHFSAVAYAGYTFDGWYIYGESTALSTDWSVDLEKSAINNKLIVAKFSEISANVNTETNNTGNLT